MYRRPDDFAVCDYCNASYESKCQLAIHQFFHTDQDVRMLQSSLNKFDHFKLPMTRKLPQSPKQSVRLSEYYEANLEHERTYEESLKNHENIQPASKIRPISDKVQQIVSLSSKYKLEKSSQDDGKKSVPMDNVLNECAKETLFKLQSKQTSIHEMKNLDKLSDNSNRSISYSQKTASSNTSNHIRHKPTNQIRIIGDSYCSRSQKKLHSGIEKTNFVRNSSKSRFSPSLLKSVLNSKITDIFEATDLSHFKKSQSVCCFDRTSSFMKSVLSNKTRNISQDTRSNLPNSRQIQSSTPKSDAFFRSSSSLGPISCSIKISDLANIPSANLTAITTPNSDSDTYSPFSPKSTVGNIVIVKDSLSHKPSSTNNVFNSGLVSDSEFQKTTSTDELRLKWKSSFLKKSAEVTKSNHKNLGKTYFSCLNSVSFSEYPTNESKIANESVGYFSSSNTSIGL